MEVHWCISWLQEERAAREAAESRAEAVRSDADAEVAALRAGLASETAAEAEARAAAEDELAELRVALAQARTATDAVRAQLTAEKIQAQQRTAGFEKQKQEIEVGDRCCSCSEAAMSPLLERVLWHWPQRCIVLLPDQLVCTCP